MKDIFEFLEKNLTISIDVKDNGYELYHGNSQTIKVSLYLTNPETGESKVISQDQGSF